MSDLDLNGGLFRPKHKAIPFNTELSPAEQTEIVDAVRLGIKSAGLVRKPPAPRARRAARPRPTLATSTPEPAPRPLTAEEQDANVLAKWARIEEQAMKRFARGESPATVSGALGIYLREAFRLQAMHRERQKEAA
jgi:hypothetical protein